MAMPDVDRSDWIAERVSLACLLECTAPKPGNVHRGADFEDLTFADFATSAIVIGSVFRRYEKTSVGDLVLESVRATQAAVGTNTNLGICLLLAPLAKAYDGDKISQQNLAAILGRLHQRDAEDVYEAIRISNPGGMGKVEKDDINDAPPLQLLDAMRQAESRDMIARQYINNFDELFTVIVPELSKQLKQKDTLAAIVATHLFCMSRFPDTLIQRKCGEEVALQSAALAERALQVGDDSENWLMRVSELDFWLRSDGHRRNPGTTADLICAALFILLVNGELAPRF